jgi:hypothetical protein
MQELDLSDAITYDYEFQKELWVNIGDVVYVWNYGNDTMYKYTNIEAKKFLTVDGDIYYASYGTIEHISEDYLCDGAEDTTSIPCVAKLGFTDLGAPDMEKIMISEWVVIEPASRTSVDVTFATDKMIEGNAQTATVQYAVFDWNNIDFSYFTFFTNPNPQPKRIRLHVRKFTYLQTIFENNTTNESLTILKLKLPVKAHRYSG